MLGMIRRFDGLILSPHLRLMRAPAAHERHRAMRRSRMALLIGQPHQSVPKYELEAMERATLS